MKPEEVIENYCDADLNSIELGLYGEPFGRNLVTFKTIKMIGDYVYKTKR